MSHFCCEHCGTLCVDSPRGFVQGCEHYPADVQAEQIMRCETCGLVDHHCIQGQCHSCRSRYFARAAVRNKAGRLEREALNRRGAFS